MKKFYVLGLFLLLIPTSSYAQSISPPLSVSPLIGPKIDKLEYFKYGFTELLPISKKNLDYAEIYLHNEVGFLIIAFKNNGEKESHMFNQARYSELEDRIERIGRPILDKISAAEERHSKGERVLMKVISEDQSNLQGKFQEFLPDFLVLSTDFGEVKIPIEDIEEINLDGLDFDPAYRFKFTNPNATRYLFAPSAIPLKKGEGYYQNVWVSLNSINYGLSDHVSISGGLELISTFASISGGYGGPLAFANLKVGTQVKDKLYLGGGVLAGGILSLDEVGGGMAMGYGLLTAGDTDNNVTLGVGYGLVDGSFSNRPIVVLSGMTRASHRLAFVSENWFVSSVSEDSYSSQTDPYSYSYRNESTYGAISGAMRVMSEKITFDIGLIGFFNKYNDESISIENGVRYNNSYKGTDWLPIPLPYLDLVYKF